MFKKAFNDSLANASRILKALAQFNRLMISANSKYDQFVEGKTTFTNAEENGLILFRNNCANCHKEPLFTDNSYRNNGIVPDSSLNDVGRKRVTGNTIDSYKFKVPSLRNVAMTFPYMHDGRFTRLKEVIDHYNAPDKFADNADSSLYKMRRLSENEKKNIIAFLLTLTDPDFLSDKRFADYNIH
jgi:cytochrome c peroxidase